MRTDDSILRTGMESEAHHGINGGFGAGAKTIFGGKRMQLGHQSALPVAGTTC